MTPACEDANSKLVEVVSGSDVDAEKRVDDGITSLWEDVEAKLLTPGQHLVPLKSLGYNGSN